MANTKKKEQINAEIKDISNAQIENDNNNDTNENKVIFSINVLKDGRMIVIENGMPLYNLLEINFQAETGKTPVYTLKKKL